MMIPTPTLQLTLVTAAALWLGDPQQLQAVQQCTVTADSSRRLELPDGRIISVDVQSVARAGGQVLAVGRFAYVFPPMANHRTSPDMTDSIIGVLIDAQGTVGLVRNPFAPKTVRYVRAVAMPDSSFSIVYATTAPEGLLVHTDTATLWHAVMKHGALGAPALIAHIQSENLDAASSLLERNGRLSFIYPFRDDHRFNEDGGLVLLRSRSGSWSADTLRTRAAPSMVQAIHSTRSDGLIVLTALGDTSFRTPEERLVLVRFDGGWSEPRELVGDGSVAMVHPSLAWMGDDLVASWLAWPERKPERGTLHWLLLGPDGRPQQRPVIDSGLATFPYELIAVDRRHPLWMYHGEPFGSVVRLVSARESSLVRLPDIRAQFWNPSTKTVALSGSRYLVFTQRRAQGEREPMAASFTTVLDIRCPSSAQR